MNIEYRKGNLLDQIDLDVICHQANCLNTFGKGIALEIKNRYPEAYEVDCQTIKGDINKIGNFTITQKTEPKVANLYGQYHYRPRNVIHTDYTALQTAFHLLGLHMTQNNFKSLGVPFKIGCGLGGGDWDVVLDVIKKFSERFNHIQVVIVDFN